MRIEQAHIATYSHLTKEFLSQWNLREYDNPEEPAFFWGLQLDWDHKNEKEFRRKSFDTDLYVKHKGFKILHFIGAEFNNGLLHLVDKKILMPYVLMYQKFGYVRSYKCHINI